MFNRLFLSSAVSNWKSSSFIWKPVEKMTELNSLTHFTVGKQLFHPLLILCVCPLTKKWSVYHFNHRIIWTMRDRITTHFADPLQIIKVSRLTFDNSNIQLPPQVFYGIKVSKKYWPGHSRTFMCFFTHCSFLWVFTFPASAHELGFAKTRWSNHRDRRTIPGLCLNHSLRL